MSVDRLDLPEWCRPPELFVGREAAVRSAVEHARSGPVSLVGPPGAGATTAGGAVLLAIAAAGLADRAVAVRLDGCCNVSDIIRGLGLALGLLMPGDPATVRSALRTGPRTAILLDDADLSPDATRQVVAITGSSPLVTTGRDAVFAARVDVDPLIPAEIARITRADPEAFRGLPLLTRLPPPAHAVDPWSTVERIPPGSELLADIPMGLDDEGTVPGPDLAPFLLPTTGRLVLRRSIREILGAGLRPSAETLAAVVRDRLPDLHRVLADGDPSASHEDIVLLRTAAEQVQEIDLRALAAAAASRMMIRLFQPADALALTQALVGIRMPATARAALRWVQGDAHEALGAVAEAQASWNDANRALKAANRSEVQGALARSAAARLLLRGLPDLATSWIQTAEEAVAARSHGVNLAETRRIRAEAVWAIDGEDLAVPKVAEAEVALRGIDTPPALRAALSLQRAVLAAAQGDVARANDLLEAAMDAAPDHPLVVASACTLRAELAVRAGHSGAALASAERAAGMWRRTGDLAGIARLHLVFGDAHALAGERIVAVSNYRDALAIAVRRFDRALAIVLAQRIAAVESEGRPGPHVDEAVAHAEMASRLS